MSSTDFLKATLVICAALVCKTAPAQYYFNHLTEQNGLSDNKVTCFLKDKTGFLWVGTKNGLNRYDGQYFKVFRPGSGNAISSEVMNDIVQDSSGNIWVATMNGLNMYDPQTNRWETIMPATGTKKNGLPNYIIWDLSVDEKGRLWIVSDVWELSVYDPATKKFTYYDWPAVREQKAFHSLSRYRSVQKIVRKNEHEWWLGTTIGLFSLDIRSGQFQLLGGSYSGSLVDLKYDRDNGRVFLVTETGQLFCYDEGNTSWREIKTYDAPYPATNWKKRKPHALLLAHPKGMIETDPALPEAVIYRRQPLLASSILPGGVNSIYTDYNGIVWAGTDNGISYYNSRNQAAVFIPLSVSNGTETADDMSAALYDAVEDQYFVTSIKSNTVFIIANKTGKITAIKSAGGRPFSACTNIRTDRKNNIWLLTADRVYRYDRGKQQFNVFATPGNNGNVIFHDFVEDAAGNYWLASWGNGLYRCRAGEHVFKRLTEKEGVYTSVITSLISHPAGDGILIGTYNDGIYHYSPKNDTVINYQENASNPEYQQLNLIRDAAAGSGGLVWFTTYGSGLYVYRPGQVYEKSFQHISVKSGLPQSIYYAIAAGDDNRLWLLSAKGLSAISGDGEFLYNAAGHPAINFANYAAESTYPKRIFYNKKYHELLVAVAGGLLMYYPCKETGAADFPVVLTDVSVAGRSVIYDSLYLEKNKIELPYRSNSISFRFAALNYSGTGSQYEYKLRESDAVWNSLGPNGTVNFSDLASGDYHFEVRARDAGGRLSANTASFSFFIKPPFWKTGWFIAVTAGLTAFLLYRWIRRLRRSIKAQRILNYFATSLYGQNTVEDIFWDVAKNCISQLKFTDCVVYQYESYKKVWQQKAAYGPKNPGRHEIRNAIEIPAGKGIVGAVAQKGRGEIIRNTLKDKRYIVDDERRFSEIAVPVIIDNKVFAVIDSEHPRKDFYKKYHLKILEDIAAVCSAKISKYIIEERLRSKISRDLHDDIGSALTTINVLSKVALDKKAPGGEIDTYLTKIKDASSQTMESMSDIVWAINPKNDRLEAIISRMMEFAADICEAKDISLDFNLPASLEQLSFDLPARKNMFLLFKEAVNNAVKYSGCSRLTVGFETADGKIKMTVSDNGGGFDEANVTGGNGLRNMKERAAECGGSLHIQSVLSRGTVVTLEIPVTLFGGGGNSNIT